jgi:F-type H+-transporting ATPase subunit a
MMLQEGGLDIGTMVLHHTADAWQIDLYPAGTIHLPRWPDIHLGPLTLNLSPTKHVVYMILAAALVFLSMWLAGRALRRQRAGERAPKGFAAAMEGLVLFVRNDIAIANIGQETGARYAPFVMTLFFFILYANLLGLVPWGSSPTGNLAVTGALAVLTFLAVEIGGMLQLGAKGYFRTIFPHIPGLHGPGAAVMSVGMAPIDGGTLRHPLALRDHLPVRRAAVLELRDRDRHRGPGARHHAAGADRGVPAGVRVRAAECGVHRVDAARALGRYSLFAVRCSSNSE